MMKITPTQKQMIYRFHVNAEKKDNAQDINLTYTEKQRFKISKAYIFFFSFISVLMRLLVCCNVEIYEELLL